MPGVGSAAEIDQKTSAEVDLRSGSGKGKEVEDRSQERDRQAKSTPDERRRPIEIPKGECPPRSGSVQCDCIRQAGSGLHPCHRAPCGPPDTTFFILGPFSSGCPSVYRAVAGTSIYEVRHRLQQTSVNGQGTLLVEGCALRGWLINCSMDFIMHAKFRPECGPERVLTDASASGRLMVNFIS